MPDREKSEGVEEETTKLLPDASQPVGGTIDNEKRHGRMEERDVRGGDGRDMMMRTEVSCHGSESEIVICIGTAVTTRAKSGGERRTNVGCIALKNMWRKERDGGGGGGL